MSASTAAQRPRWRELGITAVVGAITALYGVALIQGSQLLIDLTEADSAGMNSTAAATILITALVFVLLGTYSAAVVTANSLSTIVAGRIREIAQYRLLGASATTLRLRLVREGVTAGAVGVATGLGVGILGYWLVVQWGIATGSLPAIPFQYATWITFVPAVISIATIALASWSGSKHVARVSPVQALSASVEAPLDLSRTPAWQVVLSVLGIVGGGVALLGGAAIGAVSPLGLPIAFLGGVASFTGFVIGARMVVPRLLRLVGRAFGHGVPARLATENAVRSPRAATRSTIGMIVGVTLVVMFLVAVAILRVVLLDFAYAEVAAGEDPAFIPAMNLLLDTIGWIAVALVGVSAVIGAAGLIANLSLGVVQRQRELGLLRAVGATADQVRSSIGLEALVTSIVAIGTGFVLGAAYGWIGAQATLGAVAGGIVPLVVPWWLLVAVAGAAVLLAAVAAVAPALRATRITPIQALAVQ